MNILVAGGCGFIGSNLCGFLLKKGHSVVAVDNLVTSSEENISHLHKDKLFSFIKADITVDSSYIALKKRPFDLIYHLASPASPVQYSRYPLQTLKANSLGTTLLLDLAKEQKAKFVFASTSEIYGDPLEHPQKETYWGNVNTRGPRACYDESKRLGETVCYIYQHDHSVDTRTVRIFNTYGPHMEKEDGRVISNFIVQALSGKPITIYGNGSQTRSFSYVSDLVIGLDLVGNKNVSGEVINLGNPVEHSIIQIAQIVIGLTKTKSKIIFKPLPQDDPQRRNPDITKAKNLLGWSLSVPLQIGLQQTITYFKDRFNL